MKTKLIVMTTLLTALNVLAQNKVSLQDSIKTALANNPRTQANALRLQAAFEDVAAYKKSKFLPSLSVNYSQSLQNSQNRYAGVSLNMNIFNGFSDIYRIQAQECNYKRMEASYNSTDSFMKNTSGQIVGLVADYYLNLVNIRENINFYNTSLQNLNILLPYSKTAEQKINIENFIESLQITIEETQSSLKIAEANYKFVVNSDVPSATDTLLETSQRILIPQTAEESFGISLEKSPEILGSKLSLECRKLNKKADDASARSPHVDLSLSRGTDFSGAPTTSAMIYISKSFDLGRIGRPDTEAKNVSAAQLDLDGIIAETKNNLNKNYIRLESSEKSAQAYEQRYEQSLIKIQTGLQNVKIATAEQINILVNLMGNVQGQWSMMNSKKQEVIDLKFSVQRNIGTLFETNKFEMVKFSNQN